MTIRTTSLQRGFLSLIFAALTMMSVGAWAHTEVTASEPGADVQLQASPEQLKLTFSSQVQLFRNQMLVPNYLWLFVSRF